MSETVYQSESFSLGAQAAPAPAAADQPSFFDALINPERVFGSPAGLANHPGFSEREKRMLLVSWARDELAIEALAAEGAAEFARRSRIAEVAEALERFDPEAARDYAAAARRFAAKAQGMTLTRH